MKSMKMSIVMLLFSLFTPCSPAFPAGEEDGGQARENYEKSMQERLGRLGARLDELKRRTEAGTERAEEKVKEQLADAEKKRREAVRKLEELGRSSKETWKKFSDEVEKAARDFEQAFERVIIRRE